MGSGSHNFAPFLDTNPDCPREERFKALAGDFRKGLQAFVSDDGVRFTPVGQKPVIAKGAFDSLNLAFWDTVVGTYREYHRDFRQGRDIRTGTSNDFVHWTDPEFLSYEAHRHGGESDAAPLSRCDPANQLSGRVSQLYTNQIILTTVLRTSTWDSRLATSTVAGLIRQPNCRAMSIASCAALSRGAKARRSRTACSCKSATEITFTFGPSRSFGQACGNGRVGSMATRIRTTVCRNEVCD